MADQDRRLGKGLGALLGENLDVETGTGPEHEVALDRIKPNPFQPRTEFDADALADLADSISQNGLLQPIVVRDVGEGYQIVAGERRFRAISQLGWESAPIVVRGLTDEQMLVIALVENLQRENLSILEEAQGYERLIDEFGLTQEEVGRHVGRDRSTVSNALRLLTLPAPVQALVSSGELSAGHARAILSLADAAGQIEMGNTAAREGWSVRETERRVKAARPSDGSSRSSSGSGTSTPTPADPMARRAELILERVLGTQVRVRTSDGGSGELRIAFHDGDDFLRLLEFVAGPEAVQDFR